MSAIPGGEFAWGETAQDAWPKGGVGGVGGALPAMNGLSIVGGTA
jgi:hypothetical protein